MSEILTDRTGAVLDMAVNNGFDEDAVIKALLSRGEDQKRLFQLAGEKRSEYFPDEKVEVRSVIEVSNVCRQGCKYCGINHSSKDKRYVIGYEEIMGIVGHIYSKGRRVLMLQSGENNSQNYIDYICRCVAGIKQRFDDLIIILCLGNLHVDQYRQLRDAGAERYILKFETSNPSLYEKIKPGDSLKERIECLHQLIELGFEVGSGNITGLPGQTMEDIVRDLFFISGFSLSMVSCSVFIPGKGSAFCDEPPGDIDITLNFMALMRIMYPHTLIPTTSSLEKVRKGGQYLGLMAGANTVTVHDGTPPELKKHFPIYSADRFTPNEEYIRGIVSQAGLKFPGFLNENR